MEMWSTLGKSVQASEAIQLIRNEEHPKEHGPFSLEREKVRIDWRAITRLRKNLCGKENNSICSIWSQVVEVRPVKHGMWSTKIQRFPCQFQLLALSNRNRLQCFRQKQNLLEWYLQGNHRFNYIPEYWPPMAQQVKNLPAMQETQEMRVQSLGWEDPLQKESILSFSSILTWKLPRTEESSGLYPKGWQRARHDWATKQAECWPGTSSTRSAG